MTSSVLNCLKFTWDTPSLHSGQEMPVLDTVMWLGIPPRKLGVPTQILPENTELPENLSPLKVIILYKFYRKTMANKTPLHHRSAVIESNRIQTASNEFIRRFKNTSRNLPLQVIESVIKEYSRDLRRGGFTQEWVKNALNAASVGYGRMVANKIAGISFINRPEHSGRKSRRVKKLTAKSSWFNKPNNPLTVSTSSFKAKYRRQKTKPTNLSDIPLESVLFVPFTPNSGLKKSL